MYTAEAKDLKEELFELVDLLEVTENFEKDSLTTYEKFQIALGMQKNRLYMEANVLGTGGPSALEKLSMVLEEK